MRRFTLLPLAFLCVLTAGSGLTAQSPPPFSFRGLIDHVSADQWGNVRVQIRAVVAAEAPGAGIATGTVEFRENGTLLGTVTLVNGVATLNKNFKRGTHPLTATYAGNTNFTGSSGAVTHNTQ